jgi:hypothetical protein
MAAPQIWSRERWCPRCKAYTTQSRDVERWRVSGPFTLIGHILTILESPIRTWFCEGCRHRLRPLQRSWLFRPAHSTNGWNSDPSDDEETDDEESDDE